MMMRMAMTMAIAMMTTTTTTTILMLMIIRRLIKSLKTVTILLLVAGIYLKSVLSDIRPCILMEYLLSTSSTCIKMKFIK